MGGYRGVPVYTHSPVILESAASASSLQSLCRLKWEQLLGNCFFLFFLLPVHENSFNNHVQFHQALSPTFICLFKAMTDVSLYFNLVLRMLPFNPQPYLFASFEIIYYTFFIIFKLQFSFGHILSKVLLFCTLPIETKLFICN